MFFFSNVFFLLQVTRLLPDAVGTTCNQRLEKVYGAEHSHILRVPFRTEEGIVRKWISRFEVWPYIETFTEVKETAVFHLYLLNVYSSPFLTFYLGNCSKDVAHEIAKELQAKPDLIIGNYSEGNLVASLLAHKLGVTQVYGAHVQSISVHCGVDLCRFFIPGFI